ncbi:3'-5' exonuclease [Segniliparus rotundus DSM 44985]|uniref:3'-5' exonuclease n=1 Tax=Segniliparus rotundus (strain ATCC BAA-972 / CDC 1076 / CIP 108378 / DSM 44985 / JCM 13578) TaxID=640132 RepID=D6Z8U9_SEGRD|nr:HRDC domain-containing protein [Segniliparus rotundus]ADG98379.1 3'-5' exonuclease [Segniliparus rotundus DSM 44985]
MSEPARGTSRRRVRERRRAEPPTADEPTGAPMLLSPAEGVPAVTRSPGDIAAAARRLAGGQGPLAVDAERASGFRYWPKAYLVQFRRQGSGTVLLDPIGHPEALEPLAEAVNGLEWVLHAADQDLPCLAELGLRPAKLFDTELGGRIAGFERVGLAALVEALLGVGLAKGHGAADWSQRPLPPEWLNYAALDVELLIPMREALLAVLAEQGKTQWALEEFEHVRTRPPNPANPERWRRTGRIHEAKGRRALAVVRELWLAREELAKKRDIAPGRVLPDTAVVAAANNTPLIESLREDAKHAAEPSGRSQALLKALPIFSGPNQIKMADWWLGAIFRGANLPEAALPPVHPKPATGDMSARKGRNPLEVAAAKSALAALSEQHKTPQENLLSPETVRRLCAWYAEDEARLAALPKDALAQQVDSFLAEHGARRWQRGVTAAGLAAALLIARDEAVRDATAGAGETDGETDE